MLQNNAQVVKFTTFTECEVSKRIKLLRFSRDVSVILRINFQADDYDMYRWEGRQLIDFVSGEPTGIQSLISKKFWHSRYHSFATICGVCPFATVVRTIVKTEEGGG